MIEAHGPIDFLRRAWVLHLNPGGETVQHSIDINKVPEHFRYKLLSEDDCKKFMLNPQRLKTKDALAYLNGNA